MTPDACSPAEGCITCGDVAVVLTALEAGDVDVRCRDDRGRAEVVDVELVGPVVPGDRLLVHAGTALTHLPTARTATLEERR